MAPIAAELGVLRALTYRISSTPTSQLPQHVPAIAASLANCRSLFSSTQATASKSASESSVIIHKYRTLLSSLLQDRTVQGRWAAIVLIKSTIEIGGWETLQKSLPWVRGLLGILSKPDPPSSKRLCLITLTRIFVLTKQYPTLVREITTPSLSPFIQSSLQLASSNCHANLLQTILECFNQLLPRHPTVFRSFLKQLYALLAKTLAPTPSSSHGSEQTNGPRFVVTAAVAAAACQLYTQLPNTAPKGASADDWQESLNKVIKNTHRTSDKVFRAVVEEWRSSARDLSAMNGHAFDGELKDTETDSMALPPWSGIFAGGERLVHLLSLIKNYLECPTAGPVNFGVGALVDLLTRVLSVTVPSSSGSRSFQNSMKFNNQISKEERESLWLILPNIHVAAVDVMRALSRRCDVSTLPIDISLLDQMAFVFSAEKHVPWVRTACYLALTELLQRSGPALPKSTTNTLGPIIRKCCDDLLPNLHENSSSKQPTQQTKANGNSQQALTNADTFLNPSKEVKDHAAEFTGLWEAAYGLLTILLANIRPQNLSESMRTRMDRTSILLKHRDAMVASVLNQPPSNKFGKPSASILPLLAREYPIEQCVEALIRPRMPVVRTSTAHPGVEDEDDKSEQEQMTEDEDVDDAGDAVGASAEASPNAAGVGPDVAMAEPADCQQAPARLPIGGPSDVAEDVGIEKEISKRQHEGGTPPSPAKRVKFGEVWEDAVGRTASEPTAQPPISTKVALSTASATEKAGTSYFSAASASDTSAAVSLALSPTQLANDSDDDDVVSLVLGQDTDEDSD